MYVSGLSSYWQTGDKVNINGAESSITVSGDRAYVDGEFSAEDYCIVFPNSIYRSSSGTTLTLNMPATYQYLVDNEGRQILNAPMVYYGETTNGKVLMRHLTGAINVQISGPEEIVVDRITISTTQNRIMCGEMQFDLSDIDNIGSSISNPSAENTIQMLFDQQTFSTGVVQIPIPVLTGDVNFVIKVDSHIEGTKYKFERAQTTGGHLGRGVAGTATVNLNFGQPNVSTSALFETWVYNNKTYYLIQDPTDLRIMSEANYGNGSSSSGWVYGGLDYRQANYLLTRGMDMKECPIKSIMRFQGELNGNGWSLANLTVFPSNSYYSDYLGLLLFPNGAIVKDLTIYDYTVKHQGNYYGTGVNVASISPYVSSNGAGLVIDNVLVSGFNLDLGAYTPGTFRFGGFVATRQADVEIKYSNCFLTPNQSFRCSSYCYIGGFCDGANSAGTLSTQNSSVDFKNLSIRQTGTAYTYIGGVLGFLNESDALNVSGGNNIIKGNITINYSGGNPSANLSYGSIIGYYNGEVVNSMDGVNNSNLTITASY